MRDNDSDSGELQVKLPPETTVWSTGNEPPPGLGLGTLPGRFMLLYPILFMLPFPLTLIGFLELIPGYSDTFLSEASDWLIGLHEQLTQPIIARMGPWLTGEAPSFEITGSGDGLASYLGALLNIIAAGALSIAWWLWRRSTPVSSRIADASRVLLRYFLATIMLSYGLSKVFPLQFSVMGPDRLLQPYGDSSPMGLLWTFMGASPGYQIFSGAAELLGGLLLLFRRTTLLGALVVAAVMTNVFALNVFFDVPVKLNSFHYLLFAIFLLVPDVRRLFGVLVANIPVAARDLRPFWHGSRRWRRVLALAKAVLIVTLLGPNIDIRLERMRSDGPWAPRHELHGIYRVESFEVSAPDSDTRAVADAIRWVRVGFNPPWVATVQRADGTATRLRMRLDEEASTIALFDRSLREPPTDPLRLERLGDERIRLTGIFDELPIQVTLRRHEDESLFTTRGFHWISEYPFNR